MAKAEVLKIRTSENPVPKHARVLLTIYNLTAQARLALLDGQLDQAQVCTEIIWALFALESSQNQIRSELADWAMIPEWIMVMQENLELAVAAEEGMGYQEPPRVYQPVRQCLGYILLLRGNWAQADKVCVREFLRTGFGTARFPYLVWTVFQ